MSFLNNFNVWRDKRFSFKFSPIFSFKPKKLYFGLKNSSGRDNTGRVCNFHRGGGHSRAYRLVDISRDSVFFWNIPAVIISIDYDPNRSSNVALILFANGFLSYILCAEEMSLGNVIILGTSEYFLSGDRFLISAMPFGTKIHNVHYWSRSAGVFSKFLGATAKNYLIISLPSGKKKLVLKETLGTLGIVGNSRHYQLKKYKAGQSRWLSIRPKVRGVSKNPIDHPMGGGQGKTSGGRVSVTPWGIYTKGYKTKRKLFEKLKAKTLTF